MDDRDTATSEDYYEALHADDSTPTRAWICACWADKPHRVALDIVERWREAEANRDGYQIELECAEDEMRRLRADCLLDREESDRMIAELRTQLAAAQAECERLRSDEKRLDWLLSFAHVTDVGDEEYVAGICFRENVEMELLGPPEAITNWSKRRFIDEAMLRAGLIDIVKEG